MPVFWVGIRDDLSAEQHAALERAGVAVEHDRQSLRDYGVPVDWQALRTFARVSAASESEAKARVAEVLELRADELIAFRRRFYRKPLSVVRRSPTLIAFLGGLFAAIIAAITLWNTIFPPPGPPKLSVQYVLDVSQAMNRRLGGEPLLAVVKRAIVEEIRNTPSAAAAIRTAGGGCEPEYVQPLLDFATDNAAEVEEELADVTARGKSDFSTAIRHAAADFLGEGRAAQSQTKTLVIFVAGNDTCTGQPKQRIRDALHNLRAEGQLEVRLRFVGVQPTPAVRRVLRAARREARGLGFSADTQFPRGKKQLKRALGIGDEPAPPPAGTETEPSTDAPTVPGEEPTPPGPTTPGPTPPETTPPETTPPDATRTQPPDGTGEEPAQPGELEQP